MTCSKGIIPEDSLIHKQPTHNTEDMHKAELNMTFEREAKGTTNKDHCFDQVAHALLQRLEQKDEDLTFNQRPTDEPTNLYWLEQSHKGIGQPRARVHQKCHIFPQ